MFIGTCFEFRFYTFMLIDTHAHLNWDSYKEDFDAVIDRMVENDVRLVINVGTDLQTSQEVLQLTSDKVKMYATVGLHPHEAANLTNEASIQKAMEQIEQLIVANKEKVVAVGECGLDFFFRQPQTPLSPKSPKDPMDETEKTETQKNNQKILLQSHIDLARKLNLPLVIHCRNGHSTSSDPSAWETMWEFDFQNTKGVFHCWSGNADDAKKAIELGYFISLACTVTYPKNQPLRDLIKELPLEYIVTETDCPFLPPQQIRGQRNDPSYIPEVIKVIAEVKGISEQQVAEAVLDNAKRLFKI
jgi:TatD DNase family protein